MTEAHGMKEGLAAHLRDLAGKVERGELCNGEVWERLYADGPVPVDYSAGPVESVETDTFTVDATEWGDIADMVGGNSMVVGRLVVVTENGGVLIAPDGANGIEMVSRNG